eukprot:CAMPEP_0170266186 /NCGR_PEP_ID=MMETSP0116_2-20130129/33006_1 /TAXON_ID=400756 /ORGANISM="Durinskia baltica, Strain CSIRO CS-38" /LENGTH=56 /DNA_ID=CAMNT_0010517315 /DNA_START=52 /DNA_END=219 /DNA_ORIENTATION=+
MNSALPPAKRLRSSAPPLAQRRQGRIRMRLARRGFAGGTRATPAPRRWRAARGCGA